MIKMWDFYLRYTEECEMCIRDRYKDGYTVTLTGRVEKEYAAGMERFLDEARILAKLQNLPNIVSVQNYFKENNTCLLYTSQIIGALSIATTVEIFFVFFINEMLKLCFEHREISFVDLWFCHIIDIKPV